MAAVIRERLKGLVRSKNGLYSVSVGTVDALTVCARQKSTFCLSSSAMVDIVSDCIPHRMTLSHFDFVRVDILQ